MTGYVLTNCDDASPIWEQTKVIVQETSSMEERQGEAKHVLELLLQGVDSGSFFVVHLLIDLIDAWNVDIQ